MGFWSNLDPTYSKGYAGGVVDDGIRGVKKIGYAIDDLAHGDVKGAWGNVWDAGWDITNVVSGGALRGAGDILDSLLPKMPTLDYEDRKVMARDADTPRRVVYGRTRVGGVCRYIESSGGDSNTLHLFVIFAPHSCADIVRV